MNRIEANIAGTKIPLRVSEDEEVYVKKAIAEINDRIKKYQSEFTQKDIQECIMMALLTYAVDYHKIKDIVLDEKSWNTLIDIHKHLEVVEVLSAD
jgi:cell division protein ZapA